MSEELHLVVELAIILISAGVFTIISKALKQPLILGYIVAGFLIGPSLGLFPQFSQESVKQWSEIGIIFLLFSLGLEFSFKKLLKAGSAAIITALLNCVGMYILGILAGRMMHWEMMESIFLGGLMSMSSTTIIIKAYNDLKLKDEPYSSLVFSILVVEDLIAVVLMVLLSTVAVSNKFAGGEMIMGIAKLVFFLILWFLVGIYLIPTILKKAKRYLSDEILLLVSIGLCFMMVVLANLVGFSSALGAFVMGSILSETIEAERIEKLTVSLKDLFGAVFFVSVGMMVDPHVIASHWGVILVITIVAMVGKLLFSIFGVLLSGRNLNTATHVGFSLAQLGEFSFIIANLGVSLGVMREFIYPIIIAVSVLTTFFTPYMIKAAAPFTALLRNKLPSAILKRVDFEEKEEGAGSRAEQSEWKLLLKNYFIRLSLYSVLLVAIELGSINILAGLIHTHLVMLGDFWVRFIACAITIVLIAPFIYGLNYNSLIFRSSAKKLIQEKSSNAWPVLSMIVIRILLSISFVVFPILNFFEPKWWMILIVAAIVAVVIYISKRVVKGGGFEDRFMENLNAKEIAKRKEAPVTSSVKDKMAGYDVSLEMLDVPSNTDYLGKPLRDMPFRHVSGVNIIKIMRGKRSILIPSGDECIYPGDRLLAVGTKDQIASFKEIMKEHEDIIDEGGADVEFSVDWVTLNDKSYLTGKLLRETSMRHSGCMVISVLRGEKIITNPKPDFRFEVGDSVCLAGEKSSLSWFV